MHSAGKYILSVVSICICCGIIRKITGEKAASAPVIRTLCGIVIAIAVISPVVTVKSIDLRNLSTSIEAEADSFVQEGIGLSTKQLRTVITEKVRSYIWEKASSYDCNLITVDVSLTDETLPTPEAITIKGTFSPYIEKQLSGVIETNLGIPKEKQQWIYQN